MPPEDDTSSLERAKEHLYKMDMTRSEETVVPMPPQSQTIPHEWQDAPPPRRKRHLHIAGAFLALAVIFFIVAAGIAAYLLYFGGNSVSIDKVSLDLSGPTTISGGDTVPLEIAITNTNPVALQNATLEVDFPDGSRDATDVTQSYPRYVENLGTLESGQKVARSIKAVVFGGAGQTLELPVSLSYSTVGSSAVFVKKTTYPLAVSSTPLEMSVGTLAETVSGKPLTFTLSVHSNATVLLNNVVVAGTFPFGFQNVSASLPLTNGTLQLGNLAPGESKSFTITGTLTGQEGEERVFHFSVGTAKSATDQSLAVTYMTQDASVTIQAPFISTTLSVNGNTTADTISAGSRQNVTVSYVNTLPTSVSNVVVSVQMSGNAVDYGSIQSTSGFYRSNDHTIVFSQDKDPALASLAPGKSGIGAFTFSTLAASSLPAAPSVTLTISVSGTRIGQANVPETVNASVSKMLKIITSTAITAFAVHASGAIGNTGPIPPSVNQATTYSVVWDVRNQGNAIAGATLFATLPSYVTYTGRTSGAGAFSYDESSRTVRWNIGDIAQGGTAQGMFQVSLVPSSSQRGAAPSLTGTATFSGYDRFAGVQVNTTVSPATTETTTDPGYVAGNGTVQ